MLDNDMHRQTTGDADASPAASGAAPTASSDPDAARDWAEVAAALSALGTSIGRATKAAVDNEENRRRLRELSDGLASLARRAGESVEAAAATPEGEQVQRAVAQAAETVREAGDKAAETVREAGDKAAEQLRPHVLSAINAANEKFRRAAAEWETPPEKPITSFADLADVAEGAVEVTPGAVVAPIVTETVPETAAPEASPAVTPPVPVRIFESTPVSTDKLDAVKIAHERFVVERKAAETAAAASKAASGAPEVEPLKDESVIGPGPGAESTGPDESPLW